MKILILGGDGMLGHQLFDSYHNRYETYVTLRGNPDKYVHYQQYSGENSYYNVDVQKYESVHDICVSLKPDIVINAVAIVKQREEAEDYIQCIEVNSLFPHKLAHTCMEIGAKSINLTTDCVFSGRKGMYTEQDIPDPVDLYGKSKLLGEVVNGNALTLRTSIIGLELNRKMGLVEWFLAQKGSIKGYQKAIYTGITTLEISRVLEKIFTDRIDICGLWHLASKPISKYDLLSKLSSFMEREDIEIMEDYDFVCDRSLSADRFNNELKYKPPEWEDMLAELAIQIRERSNAI